MIALAVNTMPSKVLANTGAGVEWWMVWSLRTKIRVDPDMKLQMVFDKWPGMSPDIVFEQRPGMSEVLPTVKYA
jgi:hypothetical protein